MNRLQRVLFASCLGLLAVPAMAWEWNYGPPTTREDGYRRVHPVPACLPDFPNPGYIAIGTQDLGGANSDVYVTYTDVFGNSAAAWEATYDVEGLGLANDGTAIASVPGQGYVFLSNSLASVWRLALTAIDCRGKVIWSRIYTDSLGDQDLWGNDLIRTQSGDPAQNTNPGDFAVAGRWLNPATAPGNEDAFLMRTNAAGALIWSVAHNNQNVDEGFSALTEALPVPAGTAADLVAVGWLLTPANDWQGLVARVSGNNGNVGAAPQCMQLHGAASSTEFYNSVTRLQRLFAGQFAVVGVTRGANFGDDFWVTRTHSCAMTAQARFGNPAGQATIERGNEIIEVLVAKPGAPAGSLAIAGDHVRPNLPLKGARITLNPVHNLIAGQQWLYGINNPNPATFYSLAEDPAPWPIGLGYVFSGLVRSPNPPPADPQDLYLVHDDPAMVAPCEQQWFPVKVVTAYPQLSLDPSRRLPAKEVAVHTPYSYQTTGVQTCNPS